MKHETENLYQIYQRNRTTILNVANEQDSIVKELGLDESKSEGAKLSEVLSGLITKLQSDNLKVFVIGPFNSGKSTFINALLGQPILPSAPTPATAVLCSVKYAEDKEKRAILFPKPGMGENGNDSPFEIKISNMNEISKVRKELSKYIMIDPTSETSRYQKMELYYPLALCENEIEIIDSVGLEDPDNRDKVAKEYIPFVDVIIYCMPSPQIYTMADRNVLALLKALKYESIFFVMTKFDQVKLSFEMGETTEAAFKESVSKNLVPWTELGSSGIMFVDSLSALKGKAIQDKNLMADSGICEIEKSLESFLIREKGRAKLLNTLLSLREANRSVRKIIPSRISMHQLSIEELEKRYKTAEVPLKNLETKRQLIMQKFDSAITDISREAYDMAMAYTTELQSKLKPWGDDYEIVAPLGIIPTKENLKPVVTEVISYFKEKIDEDTISWTSYTLTPMIESNVDILKDSVEAQARDFITSVELLRVQISVEGHLSDADITDGERISPLNRLMGLGYICLTGDIVTGGLGIALGTKAMLTTIACELTGGFILGLLGLINPVTLVLTLVGSILLGGFLGKGSIKSGIKTKVAKQISEGIDKQRKEICKSVEQKVKESLWDLREALDSGLAGEINGVRDEVLKVLEEKKSGRFNLDNEITKLRDLESANNSIEEKLDTLLCEAGIMDKTILGERNKVLAVVPVQVQKN
jgi:GTPase Era involved in 16S rRNA processing